MKDKNYINDHFESHIRDAVAGHRSNFDGERMWKDLDGKIPGPQAPRRRLAWLWFAGLALLGIVAGHFFLHEVPSGGDVLMAEGVIESGGSSVPNTEVPSLEAVLDNKANNEMNPSQALQAGTVSESKRQIEGTQGTGSPSVVISNDVARISDDLQGLADNPSNVQGQKSLMSVVNRSDVQYPADRSRRTIVTPEEISSIGLSSLSIDLVPELVPPVSELSNFNSRWDLTISIFSGLHRTVNQWSYSDMEGSDWVNTRQETESSLETVEAGIDIALFSPINLGLRSGLTYVRQNEVFEAEIFNRMVLHDPLEMGPEELSADTTVRTYDYITENTARKVRHYNHHTLLRIPLLLTYQNAFHGWILGASAGVNLTIPVKSSGRSMGYWNEDIVSWQDEGGWSYRSKPYWSYQARLHLGRYISKGLILSVEPVFTTSSTSFLDSDIGVGMSQSSFGMNLSVTKFL